MSQSTASFPSSGIEGKKSATSMASPSKLASVALITESTGGGNNSNNAPTEQFTAPPLVRRSTHNYEHDSAEFFGGRRHTSEDPQLSSEKPAGADEMQRAFHNRRQSFDREDQKRLQYEYLLRKGEENQKKGFSESA